MAALADDDSTDDPGGDRPGLVTRLAFGGTIAFLAVILVLAANADTPPETPRTGRRVELVELIRAEQRRTRELEATAAELSARLEELERTQSVGEQRLARVQRRIDEMVAPAGLTGVRGSGVTVTLTDSALDASPTGNLNDLVIHEQDLQAVINALWAGGAEAMSVNGQRILATTAIRCVGNTLLLHGAVYSPPYVIQAVGDPTVLRDQLGRDVAVARFEAAARQFKLGYAVTDEDLEIPAFEGATGLTVAQIVEGADR